MKKDKTGEIEGKKSSKDQTKVCPQAEEQNASNAIPKPPPAAFADIGLWCHRRSL